MSEALTLADNLWADWFSEPTPETLRNAAAELRRLHAENEELRKDAERYRWTRTASHDWGICEWDHSECEWVRDIRGAGAIDAAIDVAMKEANHG